MTTPKFHSLAVADVRRETDDTVSIAFAVPDDLKPAYTHAHGQYLTLRTHIGGEEVRRSYSICSGVDDGELRVAIKQVPGGLFSTWANEGLKPGDALDVMTPMGRFTVPVDPGASRTYLAFAAGSGITPVMSILKTVLAREPKSRFVLVYGNRTVPSIIFREELEDLKDRYLARLSLHHVLSREPDESGLLSGRIDKDLVEQACRTLVDPADLDAVFVCGPQGMIETVRATLIEHGTPPDRIHVELFTTGIDTTRRAPVQQHQPVEALTDACDVTVVLDGKQRRFALPYGTDVILDAAHRAGADLPYSCKSGVCCTCRAKVVEGKVEMAQNYSLEPWEVEAGYVLTCQSRPLTDRVVIDFDAP